MLHDWELDVGLMSFVVLHDYIITYHSAIGMISFQAYIDHIPLLDSLIMFGTKITAKRPDQHPNTLNP